VHGNNPHPDEVGVTQLLDVYSKVAGRVDEDAQIIVLDSDDLACRPRESLQQLCVDLGIDYRDSMLKWNAGKHKCDGPWAKW
jgi:protein-lysine N-methyltransferase EEF2KMT